MRCFQCHKPAAFNGMDLLNESQTDKVTVAYNLIRLEGPDDMFAADGYVIICSQCVLAALDPLSSTNG